MVYGVFGGEYSDWYVMGYFEDKEKAEAYCKEHNEKCEFSCDEYYIKPLLNLVDNDPNIYRRYVYSECNEDVWKDGGELSETKGQTCVIEYGDGRRWVKMWLRPCDFSKERVRKIAHDALAKYKAQKAGIV